MNRNLSLTVLGPKPHDLLCYRKGIAANIKVKVVVLVHIFHLIIYDCPTLGAFPLQTRRIHDNI